MVQRDLWFGYVIGAATVAALWMLSPAKRVIERESLEPVRQSQLSGPHCTLIGTVTDAGHAVSFDSMACVDSHGQTAATKLTGHS